MSTPAFSCPGAALAGTGSTVANLPACAYYVSYDLAAGYENADPGVTVSFTDCTGAPQSVTVMGMFKGVFSTGAANPPGSTFAVTFSTTNPSAIAQLRIEYATVDGSAPGVPQ